MVGRSVAEGNTPWLCGFVKVGGAAGRKKRLPRYPLSGHDGRRTRTPYAVLPFGSRRSNVGNTPG